MPNLEYTSTNERSRGAEEQRSRGAEEIESMEVSLAFHGRPKEEMIGYFLEMNL
jgi:hypothetical protein